jgi:hypothetical protein
MPSTIVQVNSLSSILKTAINLLTHASGSWNDGDMSVDLCRKLMNPAKTVPEYGLVADTAFPVGDCDILDVLFS